MPDDYLKTADVWTILDLIVAEWMSDITAAQCFDARIIDRARQLNDEHKAGGKKKGSAALLESFAKFKAAYPRPTGMSKAKEIWLALAPSPELSTFIIEKVKLFTRTTWAGREQATIPHAVTFLRQKRYEDAPEQPSTGGRRPMRMVSSPEPSMSSTPPPPEIDKFTRHIWLLLTALERDNLIALIGQQKIPLITEALKALPLQRPGRAAAEAQLAKIEERLIALVVDGLSQEELTKCRAEGAERIATVDSSRMSTEAYRQTQAYAFRSAVYEYTGLPKAF